MTPVLSIENLSIAFTQDGRSLTVVNGVSYHINPGEVVALVGESGSGKSVTALSSMKLLGLSAQISGKTHYNGQDISCLLYTSPSPRDLSTSRMPSSA